MKIPSKECSNSLIHICHYFLLISHLLPDPVRPKGCWHTVLLEVCTETEIFHICYFSSCLPKSFSSSCLNQTRTQPLVSGIHLANLICFCMLNNHLVVQLCLKRNNVKAVFFLGALFLTFSGHSSCLSAVYPGCVYREGWRVSTCSPSPAGMQSKGEMEGEKWHTCRF